MIARVVAVRLKTAYRSDLERDTIAGHTREVLAKAAGVRRLVVGTPADAQARRSWDLIILVEFDDYDAVETYRTDPVHRAYADVYLRPLRDAIRVWNFETPGVTPLPDGP